MTMCIDAGCENRSLTNCRLTRSGIIDDCGAGQECIDDLLGKLPTLASSAHRTTNLSCARLKASARKVFGMKSQRIHQEKKMTSDPKVKEFSYGMH